MANPQVTTDIFLEDLLYMVAAVAVVLAVAGLGFIDAGLARRKNVLDTWIQKLAAAVVGAFAFLFVGYAIWEWQFNQAFGVKDAFVTSVKQWWLGGEALTHVAARLNNSVFPGADVSQVFLVFFVTFAMLIGAFIQSAGLERMKPWAIYVTVAFAVLVPWSFVTYLAWGSASPLTNAGLHDYVGIFNGYLFIGTWSIVMNAVLGPRIGAFTRRPGEDGPAPHDWGQLVAGVLLLMFAIPFIVIGSGYLSPGEGYYGISMTSSGLGLTLINVFAAYIGGGLVGLALMWRKRNPLWMLFGPLAGYIACSALFDITVPWVVLLVSMGGPLAAYGVYEALRRLRVDDPKVGPLTFGPAVYGAIMAGFVGWGVKTGGFFGLTGAYGFQHATINPGMQVVGLLVTIGISGVSALFITAILKAANGLRISREDELVGLDMAIWGMRAHEQIATIGLQGEAGSVPVQAGEGIPVREP